MTDPINNEPLETTSEINAGTESVENAESLLGSVAEPSPEISAEAAAARKEELRLAMKAFRKKLKLMKLDDESRLGRGPMSGGGRSGVVAITPPNQFSRDVWEELTEQGKLRRAGRGLYELMEP